jgi:hypothetical protein
MFLCLLWQSNSLKTIHNQDWFYIPAQNSWKLSLSIRCYRSMDFLYRTPRILQNYLFHYFHKKQRFSNVMNSQKERCWGGKKGGCRWGKWRLGNRLGYGDRRRGVLLTAIRHSSGSRGCRLRGNVRNLIRARTVQYQQASRWGWYGPTLVSSSPDREKWLGDTSYCWLLVYTILLAVSAEDGMWGIAQDWEPEQDRSALINLNTRESRNCFEVKRLISSKNVIRAL